MKNIIKNTGKKLLRFVARFTRPVMIHYDQNFQKEKKGNIRISSSTVLEFTSKLILEKNTYIGHYNRVEASHGIHFGEGIQSASYCSFVTHSSHNSIRLYGDHYSGVKDPIGYIKGPIFIGKYTFIGPHSMIMPNTKIGIGCLVKAYSYVQGEFPDFAIIGGNPAKVLGDTRISDLKTIDKNPSLKSYYEDWTKK